MWKCCYTACFNANLKAACGFLPPSSSGQGYQVLILETGVRSPLGVFSDVAPLKILLGTVINLDKLDRIPEVTEQVIFVGTA